MMQTVLPHLIAALGFCGLVGCYDITRRMSLATRHSMRVSVWVIGGACVLAMLGLHDLALAGLLVGCGLYRFFDQRAEGFHRARGSARDRGAMDAQPDRSGFSAGDAGAAAGHAMGGVVDFQAVRQDHGMRRSA